MTPEATKDGGSAHVGIANAEPQIDLGNTSDVTKAIDTVSCLLIGLVPEIDILDVADDHFASDADQIKDACLGFYRANVKHTTLAQMVLDRFPNLKAALALGNFATASDMALEANLAEEIIKRYPVSYQRKHGYYNDAA